MSEFKGFCDAVTFVQIGDSNPLRSWSSIRHCSASHARHGDVSGSIYISVSAQNLPKQRFKVDLGFCDSIDLSTSVMNDWWEMGEFQGLLCEICIDMLELGEV